MESKEDKIQKELDRLKLNREINQFQIYADSITKERYQELIEKAQNGCEESNSILEDIDGLI